MKDLHIVDVEMNNEMSDESEVLVALDSGRVSESSTPPHSSHGSLQKSTDAQNGFTSNSTSSNDEANNHSKFPPPPMVLVPVNFNSENRGEKEKSSLPLQSGTNYTNSSNLGTNVQSYPVKISTNNFNSVSETETKICEDETTGDNALIRQKFTTSINDFKILKVLGKGAYGKVYQVRKINGPGSGHIYAMKAMNKSRICGSKTDVRHTKAERDVLVAVHEENNPFIVKLHFAFETERRYVFRHNFP